METFIVLDNFRSHYSEIVLKTSELLNIRLISLPPVFSRSSSHRFFWKSGKRTVSFVSIDFEKKPRDIIKQISLKLSGNLTFTKG